MLAFSETEASFGGAGSRNSQCLQNANKKKEVRDGLVVEIAFSRKKGFYRLTERSFLAKAKIGVKACNDALSSMIRRTPRKSAFLRALYYTLLSAPHKGHLGIFIVFFSGNHDTSTSCI